MKMTPEHFEHVRAGMLRVLELNNSSPDYVTNNSRAWDVFHAAWARGLIDGNGLYRNYNDTHIETAMKKIFER